MSREFILSTDMCRQFLVSTDMSRLFLVSTEHGLCPFPVEECAKVSLTMCEQRDGSGEVWWAINGTAQLMYLFSYADGNSVPMAVSYTHLTLPTMAVV